MSSSVSIKDVAEAAGVSKATVSRVINGQGKSARISPTTQARVLAAARQLGYRTNLVAQNISLGHDPNPATPPPAPAATGGDRELTGWIGLVLSPASQAATLTLVPGLEPVLATASYRLAVITVPSDPAAARERVQALLNAGIAGLLCCPSVYPAVSATAATTAPGRPPCPAIVLWAGAAKAMVATLRGEITGTAEPKAPTPNKPVVEPERPQPPAAPAAVPVIPKTPPAPAVPPAPPKPVIVTPPPVIVPVPEPVVPVESGPDPDPVIPVTEGPVPATVIPVEEERPATSEPVPDPAPVVPEVVTPPAEPIVPPSQDPEPEPEVAPAPVVVPEPVIVPEPIVVPEPVIVPEPAVVTEPVVTPEPVVVPDPVIAPAPVVEPEPIVSAEPVVAIKPEPVVIPEPEPVLPAKPQEPEASTQDQGTVAAIESVEEGIGEGSPAPAEETKTDPLATETPPPPRHPNSQNNQC